MATLYTSELVSCPIKSKLLLNKQAGAFLSGHQPRRLPKLTIDLPILYYQYHYLLVVSPALEVNGGEEEEDARVGRVLPPELHRVLLSIVIVPALIKIRFQVKGTILRKIKLG